MYNTLKKSLILAVLLLVSSCSSYSLNNLFGQNKMKQHRNPDMQYLEEDDDSPPRRAIVHREEDLYVEKRHHHPIREEYYEEDEIDEEEYEDDDDYYDDRQPVPRDRCSFYGLKPGTAAHHDCHRQLQKQKRKRYYGR